MKFANILVCKIYKKQIKLITAKSKFAMTREVYPILGKLLKFIQTQHRVVFSITVGFKSYNSALIRRVNLTSS